MHACERCTPVREERKRMSEVATLCCCPTYLAAGLEGEAAKHTVETHTARPCARQTSIRRNTNRVHVETATAFFILCFSSSTHLDDLVHRRKGQTHFAGLTTPAIK